MVPSYFTDTGRRLRDTTLRAMMAPLSRFGRQPNGFGGRRVWESGDRRVGGSAPPGAPVFGR